LNSSSKNTSPSYAPSKWRVAQVQPLSVDGNQLVLTSTVVSEASKNRVWNSIKSVDPRFADLKHNITVVPGQQVYVVQSGDNLSKISKYFYGNAE
jgi:nucleoid-associated protein YgaU